MALALPLAILDASGTASSIARFTDGNATAPKTLRTLGDSEFGSGARPHAITDWDGLEDSKTVTYCTYCFIGSCGTSGPVVNCSCLINSPAMVSGDRYDATIRWCLKVDSGGGCSCMTIRCNGSFLTSCNRNFAGNCSGSYVAQNIDFNDKLTITVRAQAQQANSVLCACSCLCALTDQQQGSFVIGTTKSNFVVATSF